MNILYEDEHILVCEKPAGIATQAGKVTEKDMVSEVNNYMRKVGVKAPTYLIHRLDKPVRGILLFAKTKQSAASLNKQIAEKDFEKRYYALIEGTPNDKSATLISDIYKDGNKAYIADKLTDKSQCDVKRAELIYTVCSDELKDKVFINYVDEEYLADTCIVDICLLTGRFHQIRCQLSSIGHPIIGDSMYGANIDCKKRKAIGLIAYSLTFTHPHTNKQMSFHLEF